MVQEERVSVTIFHIIHSFLGCFIYEDLTWIYWSILCDRNVCVCVCVCKMVYLSMSYSILLLVFGTVIFVMLLHNRCMAV